VKLIKSFTELHERVRQAVTSSAGVIRSHTASDNARWWRHARALQFGPATAERSQLALSIGKYDTILQKFNVDW